MDIFRIRNKAALCKGAFHAHVNTEISGRFLIVDLAEV
jgi:hypothetical protein